MQQIYNGTYVSYIYKPVVGWVSVCLYVLGLYLSRILNLDTIMELKYVQQQQQKQFEVLWGLTAASCLPPLDTRCIVITSRCIVITLLNNAITWTRDTNKRILLTYLLVYIVYYPIAAKRQVKQREAFNAVHFNSLEMFD